MVTTTIVIIVIIIMFTDMINYEVSALCLNVS